MFNESIGKYRTLYYVTYVDDDLKEHEVWIAIDFIEDLVRYIHRKIDTYNGNHITAIRDVGEVIVPDREDWEV